MARIKTRQSRNNDKEARLQRALKERREEGTSLRDLALKYGVARSTLSSRERGALTRREAHEKEQAISPGMERALVKWVEDMEATGFPPRLDLFKAMAAHLASERAKEENDPSLAKLGPTWLRGFLNRQPDVSAKWAVKLDRQRALASKPGPIRAYFRLLQSTLRKYKFKPSNMYNMDEKGFLLGYSNRAKVVTRRGSKPPTEVQDGSREWITVVETACADQTMLPPMIIYKGQGLYRGWFDAEVKLDPRTVFAHSSKGFTTNDLALKWLRDYFDPWTKSRANGEPRLLLLDGHRTHYSLDFVRYAVHNNIILFSYPGHSTHLLQPLDVVLFSPLQAEYGRAVYNYTRQTKSGVTKKKFLEFYCQAKDIAYTRENIKSSWRKSGIHPFNPDIVLQPLLSKLAKKGKHQTPNHTASTTPTSFLAWKTPQNRQQLRHQTAAAIEFVKRDDVTKATSIALLRRLAHQNEVALAKVELLAFEKEDIRARYEGKKLGKGASGSRQKLIKAQVGDWEMLARMEREAQEKERSMKEKAEAKAERVKAKAQKVLEKTRKTGAKGKGKEATSTAVKKTVTIVVPDDSEDSNGGESAFEGIESPAPPPRSMALRPRGRGRYVYSGYDDVDWEDEED